MSQLSNLKIAFFGTPELAAIVLEELQLTAITPSLVICNPDAPIGRKQILTPPPAKVWAVNNSVEVLQVKNLKEKENLVKLTSQPWDLFIVAAYGNLIPEWILDLPKHGTLNVHPSLLPKLRGASPIRSAILNNIKDTGVSIMLLDKELDHGPIVKQAQIEISDKQWPIAGEELDTALAHMGGTLLASVIPDWITGRITAKEQTHMEATFCTKITKEMSELIINPAALPAGKAAYEILLKIRAFDGWPETFFMYDGKRIKIKSAQLSTDGTLEILRIVPEGKKEMDWSQYFNEASNK